MSELVLHFMLNFYYSILKIQICTIQKCKYKLYTNMYYIKWSDMVPSFVLEGNVVYLVVLNSLSLGSAAI